MAIRFDILTLFPGILESFFGHSIPHRAQQKGLAEISMTNIRDFAEGKYREVDDYAFGGGAGMVMMCQPLVGAIEHLQGQRRYDEIIYLTPDGEKFDQDLANQLSMKENLMLICGRYKGIDQRVREGWVTREISIGDYVISGGELAAAVVVDAVVRLVPGVLGDESSALSDSYQGGLLDAPVYTRPVEFRGIKVPDVLLSGNHAEIEKWRLEQALEKTRRRRPDMLEEM